ncbi:hypothetical protein C8R46DRAFT_1106808 [Mycena filopes]|nr:hypothetical protein C8R46DRAFT_1106808 [Mycena filopes]
MKALTSHPLDDDIMHRILLFLPDFRTLKAVILSSKSLHAVFASHPRSITKAIAFNLVGPALLAALNLARNRGPILPEDDPWGFGKATAEDTEPGVITPEEARELANNAVVVNTFQDIYSFRHKDRSSQSSTLSAVESLRFTRAMYRIMLFQKTFPANNTPFIDDSDTDEEEEIKTARRDFFAMFPTQDLREIYTVNNFIGALGPWLVRNLSGSVKDRGLATCQEYVTIVPAAVLLQAYQDQNPRPIEDHFNIECFPSSNNLLTYYIEEPIITVIDDREEESPEGSKSCTQYVLDHVVGEGEPCHQCGSPSGIDLWNEANWEIQDNISVEFLANTMKWMPMKGRLRTNVDAPELVDVRMSDLLRDLFDPAATRIAEFAAWEARDKICTGCIRKFVTEHLHLWVLRRKRQAGESIPADCWYGYNCRTQEHNSEHAKKLNHLCAPTR